MSPPVEKDGTRPSPLSVQLLRVVSLPARSVVWDHTAWPLIMAQCELSRFFEAGVHRTIVHVGSPPKGLPQPVRRIEKKPAQTCSKQLHGRVEDEVWTEAGDHAPTGDVCDLTPHPGDKEVQRSGECDEYGIGVMPTRVCNQIRAPSRSAGSGRATAVASVGKYMRLPCGHLLCNKNQQPVII